MSADLPMPARPARRSTPASVAAPLAASLPIALLLLSNIASGAGGEPHVLYKCVDKAGVTSIQSSACPAGSTTSWRRDATPEAPPTPQQVAQADAKRLRDQQAVRDLSAQVERRLREEKEPKPVAPKDEDLPPPPPEATPNPDLQACQDAQAFANQVREKDWLGLSEEQVRRLYGWVALQCKVPAAG